MKKSQLYNLIYSLIQKSQAQNKNLNTCTPNFATNYCNQFLKRNKLISMNKNEKIREIMQQFKIVDSYVDLNDIILAIHQHLHTQKTNAEKQEIKSQYYLKSQKCLTEPNETVAKKRKQMIELAEKIVQKGYKDGYYMQLNKCSEIIQKLQRNSYQLTNVKYKNNGHVLTFHELLNKRYTEGKGGLRGQQKLLFEEHKNQDDGQKPTYIPRKADRNIEMSPWKILQERERKLTQLCETVRNQKQDQFSQYKLLNYSDGDNKKTANEFKSKFDDTKMLHTAAVYLHMILQRQHYKKWSVNKRTDPFQHFSLQTAKSKFKKTSSTQFMSKRRNTEENIERLKKTKKIQKDLDIINNKSHISNATARQVKVTIANIFNKDMEIIEKTSSQDEQQAKCKPAPIQDLNKSKKRIQLRNNFNPVKTQPNLFINQSSRRQCLKKFSNEKVDSKTHHTNNETQPNFSTQYYLSKPNETKIKKLPRHTLGGIDNLSLEELNSFSKSSWKLELDKEQAKKIKEKFTFKKRKVKENVLKKITQFCNNMEYTQRKMAMASKDYKKQIENVQAKMNFEFQSFKPQKLLNDENALDGVRCALSRQSNGLKRYEKIQN